jgi:23S rRNA (adenine1618-N6)-methyltransferase
MSSKNSPQEKKRLHPRNRNVERYDLGALVEVSSELKGHVKPNKYGQDSIDFSDPKAVKSLNKALLDHYYGIKHWEFPDENLCPPIPGRADYLHYIADLLAENNFGNIPKGDKITCLDVGVGASCIYPIIGVTEYDWNFIGSDIDQISIDSANVIVSTNKSVKGKIDCRHQENLNDFFYGVLDREEKVDVTICNPPFHSSEEDAQKGTRRKVKNLSGKMTNDPTMNFSGISSELIYDGGESRFINNMIKESNKFGKNCLWFSTLVSKQSNLKGIYKSLKKVGAHDVRTINMGTGNKSTRIVAWTFLTNEEQKSWREMRWKV